MGTPRLFKPLHTSIFIFHICAKRSTQARPAMTEAKRNAQKRQPRNQRPETRPSPTHFLCLPLVNSTSLPQLESSIAAFKKAHPPAPVAEPPLDRDQSANEHDVLRPLIPDGSVRPLGTLHLTLGVMSLPTKQRLEEALAFFQSLDLAALMREAERVAIELREKRNPHLRSVQPERDVGDGASRECAVQMPQIPEPLSVSLESLHALPRAKAATVLHSSPVDATGRLYPFCVMLRDKFIEAGFILNGSNGKPDSKNSTQTGQVQSISNQNDAQDPNCKDVLIDDKPLLENLPIHLAEESSSNQQSQQAQPSQPHSDSGIIATLKKLDPYTAALSRKPKPRPLLLHATLVNTIYVHGRPRPQAANTPNPTRKGNHKPQRLEIDARDLLARYRDYYADETRTTPRAEAVPSTTQTNETGTSAETSSGNSVSPLSSVSETEAVGNEHTNPATSASAASVPQYPFVWAKEIPLESVCICEMGAKKLDIDAEDSDSGLNARLGEMYTAVAQRSLNSSSSPLSSSTGPGSEGSVNGGVKLE